MQRSKDKLEVIRFRMKKWFRSHFCMKQSMDMWNYKQNKTNIYVCAIGGKYQ